MIVADLSPEQLRNRLEGTGLRLRTGPVVNLIRSKLPLVASGIALHYAQHSIEEDSGFIDFPVEIRLPRNLRRWFHPQVFFYFDNELPFTPLSANQAFPMLEWGLNWCISSHCHRYLTIHSAVIERNGKAVLLPAPPGSGKSTLCAGLINNGWRLLSDELALIDPVRGDISPVPRPVSLKNASIETIRSFAPQALLGPVVHDTLKGDVAHMRPPRDSVLREGETARPGWVIFPRYAANESAYLTRLSKASAFMKLAENAFNYNLHGRSGFETLVRLVDASDCYEFSYSRLEEAIVIFQRLADSSMSLE